MWTKSKTEIFIEKAKLVHGDKYGYSLVEYVRQYDKIKIICPTHGQFEQVAKTHLISGCGKCGLISKAKSKTKTTEQFIKDANLRHDNKFNYDKVEYINESTPITIVCPNHGEFNILPKMHLRKSSFGCPKCINGNVKIGKDKFIERAMLNHDIKYDYTKVIYKDIDTKVEIICDKHGSFFQTPYKHLKGQNCPKCVHNYKDTTESFIKKAKLVHGDLFDYNLINFVSSKVNVDIVCKKHGIFKQSPGSHLQGSGCIKCNKELQSINQRLLLNEFIEKSIQVHGNKYDYEFVDYQTSQTKVKIRCIKHNHIFEQLPNSHLRGSGCMICGKESVSLLSSMTIDEFLTKANRVHDFNYDYTNVKFVNAQTKIDIKCNIHGIFTQLPYSHLQGCGCKKCGNLLSAKYHQENPSGWSYKSWIKAGLKSKYFSGFKVYIIKCFDSSTNESFFKIGKTYKDINKRFIKSTIPYDYDIIKIYEGDGIKISQLEKTLQNMNIKYKYLPHKEFGGRYECFTEISDDVIQYIF
jgi:formate dehydrogenase assembly factor FdhD